MEVIGEGSGEYQRVMVHEFASVFLTVCIGRHQRARRIPFALVRGILCGRRLEGIT